MKRYIFTGTPGSGKTTLLLALEKKGYFIVPEAATDIIAQEQVLHVHEPWIYPDFIDKIVKLQKQRQEQAENVHVSFQFFDRSPLCTYALAKFLKFKPSEILMMEMERLEKNKIYEKKVFFVQNLGYCIPTEARKISYEESLIFEDVHMKTYKEFGYECFPIPPLPISNRVNFLLTSLS